MSRVNLVCPVETALSLAPRQFLQPLEFAEIFRRVAPIEIDLGSGDGSFLAEIAARSPECSFVGVERLAHRVRKTCRTIARLNLTNARVLRVDGAYVVRYLIPRGSISAFHLLFPDPWPKRRHRGRRIFTAEFLAAIYENLCCGGLLHIATDHSDYFAQIQQITATGPPFAAVADPIAFPASAFEKKARAQGADIYQLLLRKLSAVK